MESMISIAALATVDPEAGPLFGLMVGPMVSSMDGSYLI